MTSLPTLESIRAQWEQKWPIALKLWSRFTRLRSPRWCINSGQEIKEGLSGSFAMIRLTDQAIVVSVRQTTELNLNDYAVEILAHEIGHHIYCPADLTDQGRMLARMRRALPTKEHLAAFIANLYADLLINNRLEHQFSLRIGEVYQALGYNSVDPLWTLYMRIYEILWSRKKATLAFGHIDSKLEGDAQLGARLIKVYAKDWLMGAGKFAALCFPYLIKDDGAEIQKLLASWHDIQKAGAGGQPDGLTEIEDDELTGAEHPSKDRRIVGLDSTSDQEGTATKDLPTSVEEDGRKTYRRYREPGEYGEILKSLGIDFDEKLAAISYYRERARSHLIKFPELEFNELEDPLPEGVETWEATEPLSEIDWFESIVRSPQIIPGVTTVKRTFGIERGTALGRAPIGLYVGIDCSGSMPNPQRVTSYPVLAGTILALSALRAGASVKVVLSGEPGRTVQTTGFIRNERDVLSVLVDYLGIGYAFGIHRLSETFNSTADLRFPVHIVILTDTDIFSMLDGGGKIPDSKVQEEGWGIAKQAADLSKGGATYVLHMPHQSYRNRADFDYARMKRDGWNLHFIADWEEVVDFARKFSTDLFEKGSNK